TTYVRVWKPDGTTLTNGGPYYATGSFDGLSGTGDLLTTPTLSRDGSQVAFLDKQGSRLTLMAGAAAGTPSAIHTFPAGSGGMRPMVADNGAVVVRDGGTSGSLIMLFQAGHAPVTI